MKLWLRQPSTAEVRAMMAQTRLRIIRRHFLWSVRNADNDNRNWVA